MQYSITPEKDASIYRASSSMNTGLDEVLDVEKYIPSSGSDPNLVRSLIKFDLTDFSLGSSVSGSRQFKLKMWATAPENIQLEYAVQLNPVSQSWAMGSGKRFNEPITEDGVSWDFKTSEDANDYWSVADPTSYGSTWYSGSGQQVTKSFSYESSDIEVDVTSIVEQWIASTIPNEGFVLKLEDSQEIDLINYGSLKFFSNDTNTIYKPRLIAKWDDSVYESGSIDVTGSLDEDDSSVYIRSLKPQYNLDSTERITVRGRDRYPAKTFVTTGSQYVDYKYLPSASYYAVKDAYTGEYIVPFDDSYTKISCTTARGNYFLFNFSDLVPNRLYQFKIKVVRDDTTQLFTSKEIFKVVR